MAQIFEFTHELLKKAANKAGMEGYSGHNFWTDYQLAKQLGVGVTQLKRLKTTVKNPDRAVISKLCDLWVKHLGRTREEFLLKEEELNRKGKK